MTVKRKERIKARIELLAPAWISRFTIWTWIFREGYWSELVCIYYWWKPAYCLSSIFKTSHAIQTKQTDLAAFHNNLGFNENDFIIWV